MKNLLSIILIVFALSSCNTEYFGVSEFYHPLLESAFVKAGENRTQLELAMQEAPKEQKEGMAFLISYMPQRDLSSLSAEFLLENADYAYRARKEFPWCQELPDSVFFNEVLPYANTSEDRDPWRKDFYERFNKYVKDKDNIVDAIFAINIPIKDELNVEYNTKRSRVDASPKQSIAEHMATCTGLSILLTDAFRSVGIPSRLAGTGMWTKMNGNHTWSEVLVDGDWMFTEYYPDTLNKSWFVADAGKADPENPIHWIYAVSYKPTDMYYGAGMQAMHLVNKVEPEMIPEMWKERLDRMKQMGRDLPEPYVYGVNVTQKYIDIYRQSMIDSKLDEDECLCNIVVYQNNASINSQGRVSVLVEIFKDGEKVDFGYSPSRTDDNNNFLKFKLKKNTEYIIYLSDPGKLERTSGEILISGAESDQEHTIVIEK